MAFLFRTVRQIRKGDMEVGAFERVMSGVFYYFLYIHMPDSPRKNRSHLFTNEKIMAGHVTYERYRRGIWSST